MALVYLKHRSMTPHLSHHRKPLILVIGATGTGKSNLAVQIAQYLSRAPSAQSQTRPTHNEGINEDVPPGGAEIINADAMQLYRGLPVITNKITAAEQRGIPHHLLGHIGLEEEPWTVQRFVKEADRTIGQIRAKGKVPIVVGGTSYYVHGLLFRDALLESNEDGQEVTKNAVAVAVDGTEGLEYGKDATRSWPILDASTQDIHAKLMEVDPEMARRWHPNDRKKIQRSLEIYLRTGRRASEIYEEQRQKADSRHDTSEFESERANEELLRYDPIIFWLEAEDKTLKERLNTRVDSMVLNGLLDEAEEMNHVEQVMMTNNVPVDKSKGIWVSIGYKEMEPWVHAQGKDDSQEREIVALKFACIEAVKAGTRRYAKRQNRYIRIRLANALARAHVHNRLFLLDCTDLEKWQYSVQDSAEKIVQLFLHGQALPQPAELSELARETFDSMKQEVQGDQRVARKCDVCEKVLMTEKEWVGHTKSRQHKRLLQTIRKQQLNETRQKAQETTAEIEAG